MGCASSKPSTIEDCGRSPMVRVPSDSLSRPTSPSREVSGPVMNRSDSRTFLIDRKENGSIDRKENGAIDRKECGSNDRKPGVLNDRKPNGSIPLGEDRYEKSRVNPEDALANFPSIRVVPKPREGEQVAAGWPSWLASAASEAISGWIPRRADTFQRLDKIGEGTYSSVYKARDLIHGKIVALKRVRFDNLDGESVKFMSREILILRRLDHPNIIKLEGLITSTTSTSLYLIFEYMEHDLTGLASIPGVNFTESQVKCFMQQLLSGLDYCHSHGVLHRDIKGSNLLIDNSGILKIADFGLATFFDPKRSLPLTSRVVTLWYRPPELLLGATRYGVSVDLWSAGCILGELYAGKPIMPGRTEVEQLHKIFKFCGSPPEEYWENSKFPHSTAFRPLKPYRRRIAEGFQNISAPALALMEILLSIEPASRGTASSALHSEFFMTKPFACDPSTLPKYPPSKEIDARRREEEAKRRQALEEKHDRINPGKQVPLEPVPTLSAKVNADFVSSLQKKKDQFQPRPQLELSRSRHNESSSGPLFYPSRNSQDVKEASKEIFDRLHQRGNHSGPLTRGAGWLNTERKLNDPPSFSRLPNKSSVSGSPSNRTLVSEDNFRRHGFSQSKKAADAVGKFPVPTSELDRIRNEDWSHNSDSHQYEEKARSRRPALHGFAPDDDRLHLSGPLFHPSKDLDQMLKEHDRRIQDAARRARLEKFKRGKVLAR